MGKIHHGFESSPSYLSPCLKTGQELLIFLYSSRGCLSRQTFHSANDLVTKYQIVSAHFGKEFTLRNFRTSNPHYFCRNLMPLKYAIFPGYSSCSTGSVGIPGLPTTSYPEVVVSHIRLCMICNNSSCEFYTNHQLI